MREIKKKPSPLSFLSKLSKRARILAIAAAGAVLLVAAAGVAYMVIFGKETRYMAPMDTGELIPGIFALKDGFVNVYLYRTPSGRYIAVDTGNGASSIKKELDKLGISSGDVAAVLLTHTHGDHVGGLSVFAGADIYAGGNTGINVTRKFSDWETLEIDGVSVQCIFTPGHAADSVSYLVDGVNLFSGDNLSVRDNMVGLFNSTFNSSDETQMEDIYRLSGLGENIFLFTAHYGVTGVPIFPQRDAGASSDSSGAPANPGVASNSGAVGQTAVAGNAVAPENPLKTAVTDNSSIADGQSHVFEYDFSAKTTALPTPTARELPQWKGFNLLFFLTI